MWLKTLLATLCVIGVALAEQSPVFLWGYSSIAKPALKTVQQAEFADIIEPLLKDHMVVAFQEEHLSTNDFLCSTAASSSCYAHLQGVSPKTYYASVESPAEALRSIAAEREFNTVNSAGQLETPLECAAGKVVYVKFDAAQGARADVLQQHDVSISNIANGISCPTVFMYMSEASSAVAAQSQSRMRRSNAAASGGYIFTTPYQFLLFYSTLSLVNVVNVNNQQQAQKTPIIVTTYTLTNVSNTQFSVSLGTNDAKAVTFDIYYTAGYFNMTNLQYDGISFFPNKVYAPTTFSYFCGNLSLASQTAVQTQALLWNSFQMQAPFGSGSNASVFGDPWDCVGFTTPGIFMGLFVAALLLLITFTGICWMMDINTMDRFDDPKGKTITINAGE